MPLHPWSKTAADGRFIRKHFLWTPHRWNDAKLCRFKKGLRFRVYRPDYPRADIQGYAFRSHIVYWLATGRVVRKHECLHHKNENKTDDRLENLEPLPHGEHTRLHCMKSPTLLRCEHCGRAFGVPQWRIRQRKTRFCSQRCFHSVDRPRTRRMQKCEICGSTFTAIPSHRRRFCSTRCSALWQWSPSGSKRCLAS